MDGVEKYSKGGRKMVDEFTIHFLISLLSKQTRVTPKQLELISKGKRTASLLFNIERNQLYALYELFPKWEVKEWCSIVESFEKNGWIDFEEDYLRLSEQGIQAKINFQRENPLIQGIRTIEYTKTNKQFWHRFIFMNQIVSEYRYENSSYYPFITVFDEQQAMKKWLKNQKEPLETLSVKWVRDFHNFLETLPGEYAEFLVDQMVGYKEAGMTQRQLLDKYSMSESHATIIRIYILERLRLYSLKESPLFSNLFKSVHIEENLGLSKSTYDSMVFLESGQSIEKVAALRNLKANTVKEHILEMVLVRKWKNYKPFIPPLYYELIQLLFEEKPDITYSEVKLKDHNIEFLWFRLIEIERMNESE